MEHQAMLNCKHSEADALGPVCLSCGRLALPDPSTLFLAFAVFYFAVMAARYFL